MDIPCFIKSIDVPQYCREKGLGIEDGARILRYEIFEDVRQRLGANKIAVGHNKNDQAETILMRLMRGTGLKGLCGIDYIRDSKIIRPILDIDRQDIEEYCKEYELNPKIDKTNLEDIYSRNKIRLNILPYMKKEFNENIVDTLVRMGHSIRQDLDFIDIEVEKNYENCVKLYRRGAYIFTDYMNDLHKSIKTRILIKTIKEIIGKGNSVGKKHIDNLLELFEEDKLNKKLDLPNGLKAIRHREYVYIGKDEVKISKNDFEYTVNIKDNLRGQVYIEEIDKSFKFNVISSQYFDRGLIGNKKQYLDYDKLSENIKLRNRRQGDRIKLSGGTKKIKNFFTDMKISNEDKGSTLMLLSEDIIASICGYRVNVDYKVDENTNNILEFIIE